MKWTFAISFWTLLLITSSTLAAERKTITLSIRGVIERPALWLDTGSEKAVVLMHQSGSGPESWDGFATKLGVSGLSSIAPASNSGEDAAAAVDFLIKKGASDITIIGASIGGGAVQQAVGKLPLGSVRRVVLLSTATGPAMTDPNMSKLFVHASEDFFVRRSIQSYEKASDPKQLVELGGTEHGQDLLTGDHGAEVESLILQFILK